jgi:hypothetical protein
VSGRLAVTGFAGLAVATVGAFFVTQALKVTTPLIAGLPAPVPSTIDPIAGGTCMERNHAGRYVSRSFRRMRISFYLLGKPDQVEVAIVNADDPSGAPVALMAGSGRYMQVGRRRSFSWDGRTSSGAVARDGAYDIRVTLVHQARTLLIAKNGVIEPVTVQTARPSLRLTSVRPSRIASSSQARVTISYAGSQAIKGIRPRVRVYRLAAAGGRPQLVKTFAATSRSGTSLWDGTLAGGSPAPPGRYLIGLSLVDRTCERVSYPRRLKAAAAPQAVVTVQ